MRVRNDYNKKWYAENRAKHTRNNKINHLRIKFKVFEHYGFECKCCGETNVSFLVIDHINGGGNDHRRKLKEEGKSSNGLHRFLFKNGFPDGFQTLCHNCNHSKSVHGKCIHELERSGEKSENQELWDLVILSESGNPV